MMIPPEPGPADSVACGEVVMTQGVCVGASVAVRDGVKVFEAVEVEGGGETGAAHEEVTRNKPRAQNNSGVN